MLIYGDDFSMLRRYPSHFRSTSLSSPACSKREPSQWRAMACNGGLPPSFNEYKVCYSSRYRKAHVVSVVIRMTTIVPGLSGGTVHVGICDEHSTIVALDFSFLSTSLGKVVVYSSQGTVDRRLMKCYQYVTIHSFFWTPRL